MLAGGSKAEEAAVVGEKAPLLPEGLEGGRNLGCPKETLDQGLNMLQHCAPLLHGVGRPRTAAAAAVLVLADMNTNTTMLVTFTSSIYDADGGCVISKGHPCGGVG